jgi:glycosyltransferase involved in cell wall biosynthesis
VSIPESTLRHIAFVVSGYPCARHPYSGTFVRQLVEAVAQQGVRCTVIHPQKLHEWLGDRFRPKARAVTARDAVEVLRPPTLSLSNKRMGPLNTFTITHAAFQRSVGRALRRMPSLPDAVYGHFLYSAGATAIWAGCRLGRPGFVAVGEGTFWTLRPFGYERARRDFALMTGAVAVSSLLRRRLIGELGFPPERVGVFPNGVDLRKFYPRDRLAMRRKHGLPEDRFLVIYVGNFIEPKGVRRVAEAVDGLPGVAGVFVGSGPLAPQIGNRAFCGRVAHEVVPELLSAADCFVLPSDVEGSSNATVEAMACGLPVVVSAGEFNDDLFLTPVGRRVPPTDVAALRLAIQELQAQPALRATLAAEALTQARKLDVEERARGVLRFLESCKGSPSGAAGCGRAAPR